MFPSGFLATDSRLLKNVSGFCFGIFSIFHLKKLNKNKVISININCSNCWPLSCSFYWKMIKSPLFGGNMTKGITVNSSLSNTAFTRDSLCSLILPLTPAMNSSYDRVPSLFRSKTLKIRLICSFERSILSSFMISENSAIKT